MGEEAVVTPKSSAPAQHPWVVTMELVGKVLETFGFSGLLIVLLFISVSVLGSEDTQDKFIRAVLWSEGGPGLQIGVACLVVATLANVQQERARKHERDAEIARLVQERDKWQERALRRELAHTANVEEN